MKDGFLDLLSYNYLLLGMRAGELEKEEVKEPKEENAQWEQMINPESRDQIQGVMRNIVLLPFCMGYTMVYFSSFKFQQLMVIFHVNLQKAFAQGLLTSCIPIGACIGAILSKVILDVCSRKRSFYLLNGLSIVGILLTQTRLLPLLILGRALQGMFLGSGLAIVPLYIKQFLPQMNSRYGLYNQLLFTVGIIWGFGFNLILHEIMHQTEYYWRIHFMFTVIISFLQIYRMMTRFNYETPRYLVSKGRDEEAIMLLKMIYKETYVQKQFQILHEAVHSSIYRHKQRRQAQDNPATQYNKPPTSSTTTQQQPQSPHNNHQHTQQLNNTSPEHDYDNFHSLHNMQPQQLLDVDKVNRKFTHPLAIICALHLGLHRQIIGIGAVNLYAGDIVKEVVPSLFYYYTVIVQTVGLLFVIVGFRLVKTYGRAKLLLLGSIVVLVLLLLISVNFLLKQNGSKWTIILSVILLRGAFNCTLGPIYWIYLAEIVKPNIIPYGALVNQIGSTLVIFLFPIITSQLGNPGWVFLFNALLCVFSIAINYYTLVETKDQHQLTIWQDFDKKLTKLKNHKILKYFWKSK